MNFEFSEEQHLLRQQAQTFLRDKASPAHVRAILDGEESFDQALWRDMAELGWTATTIPEAFGGLGLSHLELCVLVEEPIRVDPPFPHYLTVAVEHPHLMGFRAPIDPHKLVGAHGLIIRLRELEARYDKAHRWVSLLVQAFC